MLELRSLTKSFGGVHATDSVSLEVQVGEILALIGPNGAGKTTLVSQIAGEVHPDSGRVLMNGEDITRLSVDARARRGLARSYQITSVFLEMTALENVRLSVQAHSGHSFRFWQDIRQEAKLVEAAHSLLAEVGLSALAERPVSTLAHGQQRQLEIAMALAGQPKLFLLDEPLAGMGTEEAQAMVETIRRLKARAPVLLVEHDMDAVFQLADRIAVLVYGKLIACGRPEEIRADAEVQAAYLGEDA